MLQRRIDTDRLCISLSANQTGMAVAGIAANTRALPWIIFINANAEWYMKRLQTCSLKIIVQMLNTLFVTNRRIFVGRAGVWFCWIFTAVTVHLVEVFSFGVIGFQLVVANWPRR